MQPEAPTEPVSVAPRPVSTELAEGKTKLLGSEPDDKVNRWFLRPYKKRLDINDGRKSRSPWRKAVIRSRSPTPSISITILNFEPQTACAGSCRSIVRVRPAPVVSVTASGSVRNRLPVAA